MKSIIGAAAVFCVWFGGVQAQTAACAPDRVLIRGAHATVTFSVEVADDDQERAQGLMHRESMPTDSGMIFFYDSPVHARFWMRNTLIPLDMIFVSADGGVNLVHHNAIPLDQTIIDGGEGVIAVLEINGGLSKEIGLSDASELRHPMFDQKIVSWSC